MTTVAQMIEWMKNMPQDAIVECGVEVTSGYSTYMTMRAVDIEACEVFDYTGINDHAKYPTMTGKVIVQIQGE